MPARSGGSKTAGGDLAQGSADMQLLPPSKGSSETLDERQHAGHAAELAIELLAAAWPPQDAAATAAEAAGDLLVQRIQHKLSLSRGGSLASAAAAAEVGCSGRAVSGCGNACLWQCSRASCQHGPAHLSNSSHHTGHA